jgi:hypothetical protein
MGRRSISQKARRAEEGAARHDRYRGRGGNQGRADGEILFSEITHVQNAHKLQIKAQGVDQLHADRLREEAFSTPDKALV